MTDDGFSDPDPADSPADGAKPERMEVIDPEDMIVHDGSLSCDDCAHQEVCQIYNGFANMVYENGKTGEEPPVPPSALAVICSMFLPRDGEAAQRADVQ